MDKFCIVQMITFLTLLFHISNMLSLSTRGHDLISIGKFARLLPGYRLPLLQTLSPSAANLWQLRSIQ